MHQFLDYFIASIHLCDYVGPLLKQEGLTDNDMWAEIPTGVIYRISQL